MKNSNFQNEFYKNHRELNFSIKISKIMTRKFLNTSHPKLGAINPAQQPPQIAARYSNDATQQQQHQIQPAQQQAHHPNQPGHHIQGPATQQVHMLQSTQNITQNVAPNVQQQPQPHHQSTHIQPQINLPTQTQAAPVFTPNQFNPPTFVPALPQTYQKRERKPLPIVDPTTKQATVFSAAEKGKITFYSFSFKKSRNASMI